MEQLQELESGQAVDLRDVLCRDCGLVYREADILDSRTKHRFHGTCPRCGGGKRQYSFATGRDEGRDQ